MSFLFSTFYSKPLKTSKCTIQIAKLLQKKVLLNSWGSNYSSINHISEALHETAIEEKENFLSFFEVMNERRSQAKRSILVQVQSAQSYKELHAYCSTLGTVKHMFHYSTGVEPMHFIIVEFNEESDVKNVLTTTSYISDSQAVPISSHFLWFRAPGRKTPKLKQSKTAKLHVENGTQATKDSEIKEVLRASESINEQMKKLHDLTKLNDVGSRLRFLVAKQVEDGVSGMFPNATAYPFGSSVNGCGRMGCDLDLVLRLTKDKEQEESRLVFHSKASSGSERSISQRHMETIGDMIQLFLPGCAQVRRILQARVPIIKYYQQLADVECDLSMSNMSGVHMSDFLYVMGSIDPRVRPLVFTVRRWAQEVGLTNASPGRWITNFSLTLLVLAFLQKPSRSPPILPSLNTLVKQAGAKDKYTTEDGINCTFLRDVTKLNQKIKNTDGLSSLLFQFFEHYSQYDFTSKAVCLNEAIAITKPEHSPLYIVNPLERGLNVSKNVSIEELERFKMELREAAWILESQEIKSVNWGILALFDGKKKNEYNSFYMPQKQHKLLQVSTLFEEKDSDQVKYKNEETVKYKNESVAKQVQQIKIETVNNLKEIETNSEKSVNRRKSRR